MQKLIKAILALILISGFFFLPQAAQAESSVHVPFHSSISDLIDGVNAIRSSKGLNTLQTNSILTAVAQQQADYELSIGTLTDSSPNGLLPYQRALAAGYPVKGGFFAELLFSGSGDNPAAAVTWWNNDPYHHAMLISAVFADVGAGIASSGSASYYVLELSVSTGGTPVPFTPPAPLYPSTPTIVPNTPNPDGSIIQIVQPGDTLGSISMAYNVSLADLLKLNNLTLTSTIYVGQKIIVQAAYTPTPTQPTSTPTSPPTSTLWPTSTPTSTATPLPPTPTPSPGLPVTAAGGAMAAIVITALILALLIALIGHKQK
ncbi:MAG: LysM peptidoglycan-binding domain-containing protein [Anaerolineales bacterium]